MAVVVVCPKCLKQLKVTEQQVGKRAKCPNCKETITLQAANTTPAGSSQVGSAGKAEWRVMTGENEEFGPVTKADLDAWMEDGRLDAQCQVLKEGWEQWKWADEIYPQLAEPNSPLTPTLQSATAPTATTNVGGVSLPPLTSAHPMPLTPLGGASHGPLGPAAPSGGGLTSAPLGNTSPLGPAAPLIPAAPTTPFPGSMTPIAPAPNPYPNPAPAPFNVIDSYPSGGSVDQQTLSSLLYTGHFALVSAIFLTIWFLWLAYHYLGLVWSVLRYISNSGFQGLGDLGMGAIPIIYVGISALLGFNYWWRAGEVGRDPSRTNLQRALEAQFYCWIAFTVWLVFTSLWFAYVMIQLNRAMGNFGR